jgi:hypothetical protein
MEHEENGSFRIALSIVANSLSAVPTGPGLHGSAFSDSARVEYFQHFRCAFLIVDEQSADLT